MLTYDLLTVENFTWLLAIAFLYMLVVTIIDVSEKTEKIGDSE